MKIIIVSKIPKKRGSSCEKSNIDRDKECRVGQCLPNGIATITIKDGMKWSRRPAEGEPDGQADAQKRGKGITPSLASS